MSDNIKLIIEIPKDYYEIIKHEVYDNHYPYRPFVIIANGTPLDDVKDIIRDKKTAETDVAREYYNLGLGDAINILDYVGKAESEE